MVPDQANSILETVAASIQGTGGLRDIPVQAGDTLKDLDLSRLRLLAVLIELEDKFAIEFTPDAIDGFRSVGDITFYIHTRELAPYDDVADERPEAPSCCACALSLPATPGASGLGSFFLRQNYASEKRNRFNAPISLQIA
jgi:acyl carrier protein